MHYIELNSFSLSCNLVSSSYLFYYTYYHGYIHCIDYLQAPGGGTSATIVIHSSRPHTLTAQPYNHDAAEEAIELPIVLYGTARVLDAGKVTLYTRKSGFSGVSYVIQNTHNQTLKFTQDCSMGKNIVSHRNSLVHEVIVQPGHCEVLHHIMPDSNNIGWQSGFSASYDWV
jgi:hypothetical protein